jgi:hypothetical protein
MVFGAFFSFSSFESVGFRRVVTISVLAGAGSSSLLYSVSGILDSYYEWEKYSCSNPQTLFLNCGSILGLRLELYVVASIAVTLLAIASYLRFRK